MDLVGSLEIIEVLVGIFLIIVILIQNKAVMLNLASMESSSVVVEKRGPEKFFHNLTIILSTAFIVNSLVLFIFS